MSKTSEAVTSQYQSLNLLTMIENSWSSWTLEADPNIIIYHSHEGRGANSHSAKMDYHPGSNFKNIRSKTTPQLWGLLHCVNSPSWGSVPGRWHPGWLHVEEKWGQCWPLWVSWMTALVKDRFFLSPTCTWWLPITLLSPSRTWSER